MDSIEQLSLNFKEEAKVKELKEYCEKQYKEIVRLLSLNKQLEEEVSHLKKMLVDGQPLIHPAQQISNEEIICLRQIEELKKISDAAVLTKEESQKLDTYVKILKLIRTKGNDGQMFANGVKTEDLLKLVEDNNVK